MVLLNQLASDFRESLARPQTWLRLGWDDILRRYQRSKLGPLWLAGGLGAMTAGMGFLFSQIMNEPVREYMPFLCAGLAVWLYLALIVGEACEVFTASAGILKNYNIPKFSLIFRVVWRNIIAFFHYLIVFFIVCVWLQFPLNINILWAIPGLFLLSIPLTQLALILSFVSARYRDVTQIVSYIIQAMFFITPVMWNPSSISSSLKLVTYNPFHHMVSIVREPLLGKMPAQESYVAMAVIILILGLVMVPVYNWGRYKVIHWV